MTCTSIAYYIRTRATITLRGHIGTEMNNKAETVLVITKSTTNPDISEVRRCTSVEGVQIRLLQSMRRLPEIVETRQRKR